MVSRQCAMGTAEAYTPLLILIHSTIGTRIADLSGPLDVIFYTSQLHRLYVAIGEPGVIDVFDTDTMKLVQTARTELGAHTIAYKPDANKVYAFMPESQRASVFIDE